MTRLLLVGGGHAHVEVLRRFALDPPPGVATALVSTRRDTPYSGMLPGLIAGHYDRRTCHVDLPPLAAAAGASFTPARVAGLDLAGRVAHCADGTRLAFDLVSLDVGSTPDLGVPGSARYAIPIKPIEDFLERFARIIAERPPGRRLRIAVVGGGAGGVEVALAIHHRLALGDRTVLGEAANTHDANIARRANALSPEIHLLTDMPMLLPTHASPVRRALGRALARRGVQVHLGSAVVAVEPATLHCRGGTRLGFDHAVWVVTATAAPWLRESGLACDARGFVSVDAHLRSTSHPFVFGAGDCVTHLAQPAPKSGVYAVQQGPVLAENLRRAAIHEATRAAAEGAASGAGAPRPAAAGSAASAGPVLRSYRPRRLALALITTGGRHAVASRGWFFAQGRWVWRWKDWIDRRFMRRYAVAPGASAWPGPGDRR